MNRAEVGTGSKFGAEEKRFSHKEREDTKWRDNEALLWTSGL